jgi:hypothetical protein
VLGALLVREKAADSLAARAHLDGLADVAAKGRFE